MVLLAGTAPAPRVGEHSGEHVAALGGMLVPQGDDALLDRGTGATGATAVGAASGPAALAAPPAR